MLHKSKNTLPCKNCTRNTRDSCMAVCFVTCTMYKKVWQNLISRATAQWDQGVWILVAGPGLLRFLNVWTKMEVVCNLIWITSWSGNVCAQFLPDLCSIWGLPWKDVGPWMLWYVATSVSHVARRRDLHFYLLGCGFDIDNVKRLVEMYKARGHLMFLQEQRNLQATNHRTCQLEESDKSLIQWLTDFCMRASVNSCRRWSLCPLVINNRRE